jgi:hypothetical protein
MSIWSTRWGLDADEPLGAPFDVDWPGKAGRMSKGLVDVATPPTLPSDKRGWIRLSVEGYVAGGDEVMLSPEQTRGLRDALTELLGS